MKASDWISVKDRLPKIGERVLICTEFNDESQMVFLGFFDNGIEPDLPIGLWNIDDYGHCDVGITHWQPIVLPKKRKAMNEVSIIINGVRYDAELLKNAPMTDICKYCDLYNEKGTSECLKLNACPLFNGYIFKKSTKSFER